MLLIQCMVENQLNKVFVQCEFSFTYVSLVKSNHVFQICARVKTHTDYSREEQNQQAPVLLYFLVKKKHHGEMQHYMFLQPWLSLRF